MNKQQITNNKHFDYAQCRQQITNNKQQITKLWFCVNVLAFLVLFPGIARTDEIPEVESGENPVVFLAETGTLAEGDEVMETRHLVDRYTFAGNRDQGVTITVESNSFNTGLLLFDSQGNNIEYNDNLSFNNTNSRITTTLPEDETYRVVVLGIDTESRGSYNLLVREATTKELKKAAADKLLRQGNEQFQVNQFTAAFQSWEQALRIYEEIGDRSGVAKSLGNLGIAYRSLGEYNKAIDYLQQSLAITQEIGDRSGVASSLINLGSAYYSLEEYNKAIDYYQQSLAITQEIGDRSGVANSLNNLGNAYNSLGEYNKAIDYYQQSLVIKKEIGARSGVANTLNNLGIAYRSLGEYNKAIDYYQQSLAIFSEIGDRSGVAFSLNNLGIAYDSLGEYNKAIDYLQQSLVITQEIGARSGVAYSLNNLGIAYYSLGEYNKAIDYYQQSLVIKKEIGDRSGVANTLNNLANAYNSLGEYNKAIDYHQQSLAITQEIGARSSVSYSLNNLANAYRSLGEYNKAIDYYQQSLAIKKEIGARSGVASSLNNLGNAYNSLGEYHKAIDYYQQSLVITQEIGDRSGVASSLGNLGSAYYSLEEYNKAIDYHQQSLVITQEIGARSGVASSLMNLGSAYYFLGEYNKAIDYYQQSLAITQEIGDRSGESSVLNNLGATYNDLNRYAEAEKTLYQSIEIKESIREPLSDRQQISIFETQASSYELLELALIAQNKTNEALEITERGKARALVGQLAPQSTSSITIEEIQQLAQEKQATLVEYSLGLNNQLYIWVIQPDEEIHFQSVDFTAMKEQFKSKDDSLIEFISSRHQKFIDQKNKGDRGDSQIEFQPGDWVKFPDDEENGFEEPWQVVEYNPHTNILKITHPTFEGSIAIERSSTEATKVDAFPTALQQLHQLLIQPIAQYLPTNPEEKVIFIPHREMLLIPFALLQDQEKEYLISKHTILVTPGIQVLQELPSVAKDNNNSALVVGNPIMPIFPGSDPPVQLKPLQHAEEEARKIANLFNTKPFLQEEATISRIIAEMQQARWIHFATHGLLGKKGLDYPGAIAFAPDGENQGYLTSNEIKDMNLKAELVVLSACDTGSGEITGEGVNGLSRSFILAGVPTVVVSLWSVDDASTAELMIEFYENYLNRGMEKSKALRKAMLSMMKKYRENPKLWGGFIVVGEG